MPITTPRPVNRLSQEEFREISYTVMGHLFEIHNDFGRFFNERIYACELADRMPEVELELPITVSHGTYSRIYYLDALAAGGAVFELKAVEALTAHHRGQLYYYLLLLDLAHGKLVNMGSEHVAHEFVNASLRTADRHAFEVVVGRWNKSLKGSKVVLESMVRLLEDWGTGLALRMYLSALIHFLGGEEQVVRSVKVRGDHRVLGRQVMRLVSEDVAINMTAFESDDHRFEEHLRRLLRHLDLRAVLWVNIGLRRVIFTSIENDGL